MKTNLSDKLVTRETLANILQDLKQQGKTIVSTNGSFDLLHFGHVTMLQEARSLGDVLVVGVNSDVSIKRYKGRYRPICPEAQRVGMLTALECTDYITIFDELTPLELLKIIQPDIHVNSPEHGKECVEREVVEQYGGRIHLAQLLEGMSTSHLIQKILEASSHEPCRGVFINAHDLFEPDPASGADTISTIALNALKQLREKGFHLFISNPYSEIETSKTIEGEFCKILQHTLGRQNVTLYSPFPSKRTMIEQALEDVDLILAKSFIVSGDMEDIQIGREVNCKTIFLGTPIDVSGAAGPHFIAENFEKSIDFIDG